MTMLPTNLSCFTSSDPDSENASLLYDDNIDHGDLWSRGGQHFPLPPCLPLPSPPDSRCLVCRDRAVYAVCRNLMDGVKVVMETVGRNVEISKADCPEPPSDDAPQSQPPVIIFIIISVLLLFLVFIGVVCYRRYKSRN